MGENSLLTLDEYDQNNRTPKTFLHKMHDPKLMAKAYEYNYFATLSN